MSGTDWIVVGADVVEFWPSERGTNPRGGRLEAAKVRSIGKRDVVLDNGSRYRVGRMERSIGDTWTRRTVYLYPPDAPRLAEAKAANRRANRYTVAAAAWADFAKDRTNANAEAVVEALREYLLTKETKA